MNDRPRRSDAVDILVLSSMYFGGHQLTDQRVTRALEAQGQTVVYVEPGKRLFTGSRPQARTQGNASRLGKTKHGATEIFTPLSIPFASRPILGGVNGLLLALQLLAAFRRRLGGTGRILVFTAHPFVMFLMRRWPRLVVVKDDYVAGATLIGSSGAVVARRRRRTLASADNIAVVSTRLRTTLMEQGFPTTVVNPGVDLPPMSIAEDEEIRGLPRPRALFVGMISDRIDLDLLAGVIDCGWHLVIVGGCQPTFTRRDDLDRLVAAGGVSLMGWQPPTKVQSLAQWCDAGLLPYTLSDFNRSSSPLKLLEYLGAGLPVVSTRLPSVVERDAPDVTIVDAAHGLSAALAHCLMINGDSEQARRRDFAAANSWSRTADEYVQLLTRTCRANR